MGNHSRKMNDNDVLFRVCMKLWPGVAGGRIMNSTALHYFVFKVDHLLDGPRSCAISYKLVYKVSDDRMGNQITAFMHFIDALLMCENYAAQYCNVAIYFYQWQQEIEWR